MALPEAFRRADPSWPQTVLLKLIFQRLTPPKYVVFLRLAFGAWIMFFLCNTAFYAGGWQ